MIRIALYLFWFGITPLVVWKIAGAEMIPAALIGVVIGLLIGDFLPWAWKKAHEETH